MQSKLPLADVLLGVWRLLLSIVADTALLVVALAAAGVGLVGWAVSWVFCSIYYLILMMGWYVGSSRGFTPQRSPLPFDQPARKLLEWATDQLRDLANRGRGPHRGQSRKRRAS